MNNLAAGPGSTWQILLAMGGGVGAFYWAYAHHEKGKVWYFLGGAVVGGVIGYVLDNQ